MTDPQAERFPHISRTQILWFLGGLLVTGWLIWLLGPVLTPFFISILLAYIANPVVEWMERLHIRRDLAVALVFVLAFVLLAVALLIIVPVLIREVAELFGRLPGYFQALQETVLPWVEDRLDIRLDLETFDAERATSLIQEYFHNITSAAGNVLTTMTRSGGRFIVWLTGMVLVPLVAFYLMRDWNRLMEALRDMLPRNVEPTVVRLISQCDEALGGFLRGQVLVMISLGLIYGVGLWIVGLNNAFAIGMIAGLVSFVPYLGAIIGILLAGVTAVIQDFSIMFLLSVAAVFVIGQTIESLLLTPKLVGDRIGLHPVLVIFMVMAGGQLFGFTGILLALPVAAAGTVLVRFFYQSYKNSRLYQQEGDQEQS